MDIVLLEEGLKSKNALEIFNRELEKAISERDLSRTDVLFDTVTNTTKISKPSIAILLKKSLDTLEKNRTSLYERIRIYDRLIGWAERNRRNLLKIDFNIRKIEALLLLGSYDEALELISETAKVLKRADDKIGLVKLYYLESRVFYMLKNISKAKSSLTQSKSTATFIYCPPYLQAKIDLLSAIYTADEKDYLSATGHIIEALDGFSLSQDQDMALLCCRYLILIKIMDRKADEIESLQQNKTSMTPHKNDQCIKLLCEIGKCVLDRDLRRCKDLVDENMKLIESDEFITNHLRLLCDSLIDSNILKIIEPYSNINIQYIGDALNFSLDIIEDRLRNMILNGRIKGDIDQETMCINIQKTLPSRGHRAEAEEILGVLEDTLNTILTK